MGKYMRALTSGVTSSDYFLQVILKSKVLQNFHDPRPHPNTGAKLSQLGRAFIDVDVNVATVLLQEQRKQETS